MYVVRALLIAFCCLLACRSSTHAQEREFEPEAPEEPPEYRAVVASALAEYEAGHFEESRTLMLQAHATFPNARTQRGLGMIAFELRAYAESVRWLEQSLASRIRPLEGELRLQTEGLLARARSFTGRLTVELTPATAQLLIDGVEVASAEPRSLLLAVGKHVLEVQAESYLPERRIVRVTGSEEQTLQLALVPLATGPVRADAQPPGSAPEAPAERRAWYRNPWFWVATGVVLVGGAATATVLAQNGEKDPREPPYLGLSGEPVLVGPSQ
jgi:hypothetical protein